MQVKYYMIIIQVKNIKYDWSNHSSLPIGFGLPITQKIVSQEIKIKDLIQLNPSYKRDPSTSKMYTQEERLCNLTVIFYDLKNKTVTHK